MDDSSVAPNPERRARWRAAPWIVAALAAVVLVVGTIGPPLFGRGVFLTSDLIYLAYPWQALDDPAAFDLGHHGPTSDNVDVMYPNRSLFADSLEDGEFAGWDPWVSGGTPLGSVGTSGVLGPFGAAYNLGPNWYAPALVKLLTMAASIGFTYVFCRRLRVDRTPSALAAIAFAGSGFMVMWTNWTHVEVAALIPAVFWATERFLQIRTARSAIPIALATAGMLLGSFPAVAGYALYVLVPYVAVRVLADHWRDVRRVIGSAFGSAAGIAVGIMLAAPVVVPMVFRLDGYDLAYRQQGPGDNLGVHTLMTAIAPDAFGLSSSGQAYPGTNQVESIAFVGVTIAVLALLSVALPLARGAPRGARGVLASATIVIGTATFLGGPLLELLQKLPVFSDSFVGRTRSILGFTVSVLAALGLQAVLDRREQPMTTAQRRRFLAVLAAGAALAAVVGWESVSFVRPLGRGDILGHALWMPTIVGLAVVAALVVVWLRRDHPIGIAALALVPLLLVFESLAFSLPLLPNESRDTLYPTTDATRFLQENVDHDRVGLEGNTFYRNAPSLYGFRSATGHAFTATTWKEMLEQADPRAFAPSATLSQLAGARETVTSPALDRLGVTWFAAKPDAPPFGTRESVSLAAGQCGESGPRADGRATVPAASGVRGVIVRTCAEVELPKEATLIAHAGSGADEGAGRRPLPSSLPVGSELVVPVPGDQLGDEGDLEIEVALDDAEGVSLPLATTPDGALALDVMRPDDDGLRLAFADELVIYERLDALSRVRWSGTAETIPDRGERLARLDDADLADDVVVLEEDVPQGDGRTGRVRIVDDGLTRQEVAVSADGDGFVVLADSFQRDWRATVDGEPADILAADHAGVAVRVPEGDHTVVFEYEPSGRQAGLALSGLGLLAVLAATTIPLVLRRWRRRRQTGDDGTSDRGGHEQANTDLDRVAT